MTNKVILVTGGTGYIGSHTVIQLVNSGYEVVILDNLSNSKIEVLSRIEKIIGKSIKFIKKDLLDNKSISETFSKYNFDSVIHFAGLKAVGESESDPIKYYENNVVGSTNLLKSMIEHDVNKLIFSSSATVYGDPGNTPCLETTTLKPKNVYGQTKLFIEEMINSLGRSEPKFKSAILRYFNPVGAHKSGLIGEDPNGVPNNLVPFISQVAVGTREKLQIWGNDYPTPDGTCKRDYIHVEDLAAGHLAALTRLNSTSESFTVNLGTGRAYSVLEVLETFRKVSGKEIPHEISSRRPGDAAECFASPNLAENLLGWKAERNLKEMCEDVWRWQSQNPNGYPD